MRDIAKYQRANHSYIEDGIKLLELARRAHQSFENQPPSEKQKLLDFGLSNCRWRDGQFQAEYREPFDLLAVAVAEDQRAGMLAVSGNAKNEN